MSQTLRIDPEKRCRANTVVLKRWITRGMMRPGDEVCELDVDGRTETVRWETKYLNDIAGTIFVYVREGEQVRPDSAAITMSLGSMASGLPREWMSTPAKNGEAAWLLEAHAR